jgi:hypothetical protein
VGHIVCVCVCLNFIHKWLSYALFLLISPMIFMAFLSFLQSSHIPCFITRLNSIIPCQPRFLYLLVMFLLHNAVLTFFRRSTSSSGPSFGTSDGFVWHLSRPRHLLIFCKPSHVNRPRQKSCPLHYPYSRTLHCPTLPSFVLISTTRHQLNHH